MTDLLTYGAGGGALLAGLALLLRSVPTIAERWIAVRRTYAQAAKTEAAAEASAIDELREQGADMRKRLDRAEKRIDDCEDHRHDCEEALAQARLTSDDALKTAVRTERRSVWLERRLRLLGGTLPEMEAVVPSDPLEEDDE